MRLFCWFQFFYPHQSEDESWQWWESFLISIICSSHDTLLNLKPIVGRTVLLATLRIILVCALIVNSPTITWNKLLYLALFLDAVQNYFSTCWIKMIGDWRVIRIASETIIHTWQQCSWCCDLFWSVKKGWNWHRKVCFL